MVDNIEMVSRLESRYLDPDYGLKEAECPCSCCSGEAILDIGGTYYCEDCAKDEFKRFEDDVYCEVCGEECPDVYYEVGNERYCEDCFVEVYRM